MHITRKKSYLLIAIIVMLIVVISCGVASTFLAPSEVLALTNTDYATKVANGVDLYDSSSQSFNSFAIYDLKKKLFNGKDPLSYIKSNIDTQTNAYVVPASKINSNVGNATGGLVLNLGGYTWIVSCLTLTDNTNFGKEDIVLTLYMADNSNVGSVYNSNSAAVKGNNAYSASELRQNLLTNSAFAQFSGGSFATKYLVQPSNIKYQYTQSWSRFGTSNFYNLPNDALHNLTTGWNSSPLYVPEDILQAPNGDNVRYDAWGNDYIWIPSITEIGGSFSSTALNDSIWSLSQNQLSSNSNAWLRSGNSYGEALIQGSSGISSALAVNSSNYIRPAIHVNLSEILSGLENGVQNPQDLQTTYNENAQTLSEIVKSNKNTAWYDKNLYETDNEFIKLTYPDSNKAFENAGEYWVKVEIKESWTNKIIALVEQDAAKYGWTEAEKQQVIDFRKPKFLGTADISDPNHTETDTERWIKITVKKADIDFSNVKWSSDSLEYNNVKQSVSIVSGLPSFLKPLYMGETEKDVNASGTFYTAKVIGFESTNSNYNIPSTTSELESIPQLQLEWKITRKKINVSWKTEEKVVSGISLRLPVLLVDSSYESAIEYNYYTDANCNTPITLEKIAEEYSTTKSKPYWVKASLKTEGDYNNTNSIILLDGSEVTETISSFKVGEENNGVTVSLETSKVTYNGSEQRAVFQVSGGLNADALVVTYTKENGVEIPYIPTEVGRYKVTVNLKDGVGNFVIVGQKEFDYEIESLKITKPQANQAKVFKASGFEFRDITNLPKEWAKYFDIKVFDKENNEIGKVNGSWTFVGVNKYRIQIQYKNGMNTNNGGEVDNVVWQDGSKGNCQVSLDIEKLVLTINGWQDGEENGRATLKSDYTQEIEKYFDYVIYECSGDETIGDELAGNAALKYSTNYQISLRIKNEYKGNVVVEYNGQNVEETEPYKFKTKANPFTDGDGSDDDNNGTSGKPNGGSNGMDNFVETIKKLPYYVWILVGIILFLIILIIVILILKRNKNKGAPKQAMTYGNYPTASNDQQAVKDNGATSSESTNDSFRNVRGTIVNNYKVGYKDWTFVMKETDILNLDVLESPQDEVMFYAFKKNDLRKVKKLQSQIDQSESNVKANNSNEILNEETQINTKKQKGKKRN